MMSLPYDSPFFAFYCLLITFTTLLSSLLFLFNMPSAERTKQQAQKKRDSERRSRSISVFFLPINLYFNLSLASNEYPVTPKGRPRKGFFKDISIYIFCFISNHIY